MKSEFKNFGEALAWMMESPENVAVAENGCGYRWRDGRIEMEHGNSWMIVRGATIAAFAESSWSRAKKEPRVFRLEETIRTVPLIGTAYIDAGDVVLAEILKPFSEGTKVEVVLTVHEE